jgi:hypothetical protein|tara:strand:+ start:91 stop:213 length:123 start_codon:yes stop_codon:yes gene_type:complete
MVQLFNIWSSAEAAAVAVDQVGIVLEVVVLVLSALMKIGL